MSTALVAGAENHPAVLAKLASANTPSDGLEIAERYGALSHAEISREEKRCHRIQWGSFYGSLAALAMGVPLAIIPPGPLGIPVAVLGAVGLSLSLFGVSIFTERRESNYTSARRLREIRAQEDRRALLIDELKDRFAVDLTVEEFDELRYPRELPTAEKTIRYGSIDKYLSLEDGGGALQQVTLIWAEGEMKLLTTRLTELGITR